MFEPKPISIEAIPNALAKAERYRLLNEPREAESICRDVLDVDADNQEAIATMVLALTDQFGKGYGTELSHTQEWLKKLEGEYDRFYYAGIILERWGKALLSKGAPGFIISDWIRAALRSYDQAESVRPEGNDDAILRWNTCVRMLRRELRQTPQASRSESHELAIGPDEEVPGG